jgi:hypothetical protein
VQIGACSDDQTAADTAALSQTAYTGAATYTFIDSIEKYGTQQTYGNLLLHMTQSLRALGKTSVKPASTGAQAAGAALPFAMAIALGPIGLLGGMVAGNAIASGGALSLGIAAGMQLTTDDMLLLVCWVELALDSIDVCVCNSRLPPAVDVGWRCTLHGTSGIPCLCSCAPSMYLPSHAPKRACR